MAEELYTWVPFYTELANKLLPYKNDRAALIDKLQAMYESIDTKLPNQFHARFFRKLTKQTITKNQFKGVLFDTPLFFNPFGKQEKRAFLTNF